jgi:predicted extracellular nuclease
MATTHNIFWWNLENLFDIENSTHRSEFLNSRLKGELKNWTQSVLDTKIDNLVSIISQFNTGNGPDILGVCEVENIIVLQLLVNKLNLVLNKNYGILHADSDDKRGIDTALIYDTSKYQPENEIFTLRITKRNATRDLLQFHLTTSNNNQLIIILNHWPSRSGGIYETEPYRIMVAENLAYWIERIYEERGNEADIILMGDFNDNPHDRSITTYLQAFSNRTKVIYARNKYFYNCMIEVLPQQLGTHVYGSDQSILDQFMVSKSILSTNSKYPFKLVQTKIITMPEMVSGRYKQAIRFGRPSSGLNLNGYSDHLPIHLTLSEK